MTCTFRNYWAQINSGFIRMVYFNIESKVPYSKEIMERHYSALSKETHKSKQSPTVINAYLNKEFEARRKRIESMTPEERHKKVFDVYPCFKDHVEVTTCITM